MRKLCLYGLILSFIVTLSACNSNGMNNFEVDDTVFDPETFSYGSLGIIPVRDFEDEIENLNYTSLENVSNDTDLIGFLTNAYDLYTEGQGVLDNPNRGLFEANVVEEKSDMVFNDYTFREFVSNYPNEVTLRRSDLRDIIVMIDDFSVTEGEYFLVDSNTTRLSDNSDEYLKVVMEGTRMDIYFIRHFEENVSIEYTMYDVTDDDLTIYYLKYYLSDTDEVENCKEMYYSSSMWLYTDYWVNVEDDEYGMTTAYYNKESNQFFSYDESQKETFTQRVQLYNPDEQIYYELDNQFLHPSETIVKFDDQKLEYSLYLGQYDVAYIMSLNLFDQIDSFEYTAFNERYMYGNDSTLKLDDEYSYDIYKGTPVVRKDLKKTELTDLFDLRRLPVLKPTFYDEFILLQPELQIHASRVMDVLEGKIYSDEIDTNVIDLDEIKALKGN